MAGKFDWNAYQASVAALVAAPSAGEGSAHEQLLAIAEKVNECRATLVSVQKQVREAGIDPSPGIKKLLDEAIELYNRMSEGLLAACAEETCSPEEALSKAPSKTLQEQFEKLVTEITSQLEEAVAKEKAKLERAKRKREREAQAAKEEEERKQREIEEAAAKEKAKLERAKRKREREAQAAKEEEERKQREIEEAREKRAISIAFLKEKARRSTAPIAFGGLTLAGLVSLVIWFPTAGYPALALFVFSELFISPACWGKAARQVRKVLNSGQSHEILATDLTMEGESAATFGRVIVMAAVQLLIGIILSLFFWIFGMEGGVVDLSKFIFPLGWKAGAGFLLTGFASALTSVSWAGVHRSIHAPKILKRLQE